MKDGKAIIRWVLLGLFLLVMAVIQFIPGENAPEEPPTPSSAGKEATSQASPAEPE